MGEVVFFQEIAQSYYEAGMAALNRLKVAHDSERVGRSCDFVSKKLVPAEIEDKPDLIAYVVKFMNLQLRISRLYDTRPQNACDWIVPLLKECYHVCGIDCEDRFIFTLRSTLPQDYGVFTEAFGADDKKTVDVFNIPQAAAFDLGSIAVIGHEVGHILYRLYERQIRDVLIRYLGTSEMPVVVDDPDDRVEIRRLSNHLKEHLCDLIGARLFGVAFDLAFLRLFITYSDLPDSSDAHPRSDTHPRMIFRMKLALDRMKRVRSNLPGLKQAIENLISVMTKLCKDSDNYSPDPEEDKIKNIADHIFANLFQAEVKQVDTDIAWTKVCPELDGFRPPFETVDSDFPRPISPREIVVCTSLYYYGRSYDSNDYYRNVEPGDNIRKDDLRKILSSHMNYAIEISEFVSSSNNRFKSLTDYPVKEEKLKHTLWRYRGIDASDLSNSDGRLIVTPTISPCDQYSENAVDLRLGSSFLVSKLSLFTHVSPQKFCLSDDEQVAFEYGMYDRINIPIGREFILHPHQFVLACTLEYVCLPLNKYAFVLGRSTWGRLGLNIATATTVQPGYRGCLTLELRNLGETPLPLTVGTRVAQITIVSVSDRSEQGSPGYYATGNKYIGPVCVGLPKINKDPDWDVLKPFMPKR